MSELRNDAKRELTQVLKNFIEQTVDHVYNQEYIGKVVNNKDPEKNGRCQIRVYGVFGEEIIDSDLPWAIQESSFIGSEKGSFIVPPIDSLVYVRFSNGDLYSPIYSRKVRQKGSFPSDKNTDYPNTMVFFELDGGDKFTINNNTGETIYEQRHGLKIQMKQDGSFVLEHKNGTIFEVDSVGNVNLKSGENNPTSVINISSGAAGSIVLQGGSIPCPDLLVDPVTGAPMATGTLVPGKQIFIP